MRGVDLRAGLCAVVLLAGCDGSPSEPRFDPVGSISFAYSGVISGSYEARGVMEVEQGAIPAPVTGATAYLQDDLMNLLAFRAQTSTRGDAFTLLLGAVPGTGSLPLDPLSCQQQVLASCRIGFFVPDVDVTQLTGPDLASLLEITYVLVLGNVEVTTRTDRRIRGTFQAIAFRGNEENLQNSLTITNGSFDLPIRPQNGP